MPSPSIYFHNLADAGFLRRRGELKSFIARIFKSEGIKVKTVDIIFCSDEYLLSINQRYLKHDDFTDTISFTLSDKGDPVIGEIYISIDRIKENAATFQTSASNELHRVIFHSVLHLCGYEDNSVKKKEKMRSKENTLLNTYFG